MQINRVNTHILPLKFEYHSPTSLTRALELLRIHGNEACILAGGTDVLINMKKRTIKPKHVINIKSIESIRGVTSLGKSVLIGAATRLRDLEKSDEIKTRLPALHDAVSAIGSIQIRNMATIGGNICNASPAADSAVALIALNAEAHLVSVNGERIKPVEDFFLGPGETALEKGELLTRVSVPNPVTGSGSSFSKIGRTKLDIATVNVAAKLSLEDLIIKDCRIALGSVAPRPIRSREAENFLQGKKISDEVIKNASEFIHNDVEPITDIRATDEYRRETTKALVIDALRLAWSRAKEH